MFVKNRRHYFKCVENTPISLPHMRCTVSVFRKQTVTRCSYLEEDTSNKVKPYGTGAPVGEVRQEVRVAELAKAEKIPEVFVEQVVAQFPAHEEHNDSVATGIPSARARTSPWF